MLSARVVLDRRGDDDALARRGRNSPAAARASGTCRCIRARCRSRDRPRARRPASAAALKPMRRSPIGDRASRRRRSKAVRQRPWMLSNSSRCAVAAAPPLSSLTCTTSSRLPARGSSGGAMHAAQRRAQRQPPDAAHAVDADRHARSPLSARCPRGVADLVEPRLQRHPVERRERQAGEDLDPPADHARRARSAASRARSREPVNLAGIGQRPGAGDDLVAEVRTDLAVRACRRAR